MRIAIVTQPLCNNFGGVIQNFALQQALIKLGHRPVTLNYRGADTPLSVRDYLRHAAMFARILPALRPGSMLRSLRVPHAGIRPEMQEFISRHITATEPMRPYTLPEGIDAVIVGSDQVWRPRYNDSIPDMFLAFTGNTPMRRIAYAASFGVDNWEYSPELTDRCRELARRFDAISVREESGIELCRARLSVDATLTLDPTLLLGSDDYLPLCASQPGNSKPFTGAYLIDADRARLRLLHATARRLGNRAMECNPTRATLPQWLAMFRDASHIVTDSFHGTVFSIIFHKPFTVIGNSARGLARFSSLLSALGLESRIASPGRTCNLPAGDIDWEDIDSRLAALRAKSMEFLRNGLNP